MLESIGIARKWEPLVPLVAINLVMLLTLAVYAFRYKTRPRDEDLLKRVHSRWLGAFFYGYWGWVIRPLEDFFIRRRFSPDFFTTLGFVLSALSALCFATAHFGLAGWLMILGGTCDMFDGRVARRSGRVSKSGAFYDAVMDRFSEGVVFLGLAIHFRNSWVLAAVILSLVGSMIVSYTRAKGDSLGIDCKIGPMQRPERIVYLGVASIFSPTFRQVFFPEVQPPVEYLSVAALVLIALMTNLTATYRMLYIMRKIRIAEGVSRPEPSSRLLKKLVHRYFDI